MPKTIHTFIQSGYGGRSPKVYAQEFTGKGTKRSPYIKSGRDFVIDLEVACKTLDKVIALNGFTESKAKTQKIIRLIPRI